AQSLTAQARAVVKQGNLLDYATTALVHAVSARTKVRSGDVAGAKQELGRTTRLRPLLTYAMPASAQVLLEMGSAYIELADPGGARTVHHEVRCILRQRPDLGVVPKQADELQSRLEAIREKTRGVSSLTAAELRLLPLLATYLSIGGIAERLHVSRNTV